MWSPTTQKLITSLRAFLRYLSTSAVSPAPISPSPFQLSLTGGSRGCPRCLSAEELERLIAACDGTVRTACAIARSY